MNKKNQAWVDAQFAEVTAVLKGAEDSKRYLFEDKWGDYLVGNYVGSDRMLGQLHRWNQMCERGMNDYGRCQPNFERR